MSGTVLLRTRDPVVERRCARALATLSLETRMLLGSLAPVPSCGDAVGLLVELELDGALELIREWRAAHPATVIVAYVAMPDAELWRSAEAAGADAVSTRGRVDRILVERLDDQLSGRRRARRLRLAPMADFAGRLGFVGRIEESPAGPIALYHLSGRIWAIADVCPHAGASLCDGELDGDIVTCPRHGSQFRVTDGERVRGPSDREVATFPVVIEAGDAFVELP